MKRRIVSCLLMISLLALVISGCSQGSPSSDSGGKKAATDQKDDVNQAVKDGDLPPLDDTAKVTIAEDGSASGAGFYIAKEKGYFKDYNINVKFAKFSNSDDMLPALSAGKIDVAGGVSSASFFNSIAQGINVKMIADKGHNLKGQSFFSFVVRKDLQDKVKDYKDIKGKRIAVSTKNGVDDYIFSRMLKHAGLTRDDVEFKLMPDFGNMIASMGNNSLDLALQIEPLITQGETKGVHVRFGDTTDFAPKAQIAMVLGSPKFVDEKKDVSLRFMTAYLKGVRDYNDAFKNGENKDEIIDIMMKHTAVKDPKVWNKVGMTGLDPDGKMFVDNIKDQYKWYKKRGGISGDVDFDKAVDTSLVEKAAKILGEAD